MAGEAFLVLVATAATGASLQLMPAGEAHSAQAVLLVQLATAAGAAMVALQCGFLAQLLGDRRLLAVGTAWAFYGLVLMPLSVIDDGTALAAPLGISATVGQLMFLTLLASGLRPVSSRPRLTALRACGLAVLATAVLSAAATLLPAPITGVLVTPAADQVVLIGWTLLAVGFAARGIVRAEPVWWRLALGIAVEAAARFDQLDTDSAAGESLRFVALRLLGFVVLVVGLGLGVRQANRRLRLEHAQEQERAAAVERSRASRDHEIRNALSNLAAITVLAGANKAPQPGDVAESVNGELARLRDLLEDRADRRGRRTAPVDLVLRRLVLLRRAGGLAVTLDCPAELNAALPTDVLTEVLTNLLANCERHAPGAAVRVEARRVNGRCRIDVSDSGPGLAAAGEGRTRGSGIGLALSSQLMIENGGGLRLLPHTEPTGCTARLDLPLADGPPLRMFGTRATAGGTPRHRSGTEEQAERSA